MHHLDDLQIPDHLKDFRLTLDALLALNLLVSNPVLPPDYPKIIQNWRQAWSKLRSCRDITTTNKIHIINDHLEVITYISIVLNSTYKYLFHHIITNVLRNTTI